jgi:hypothetical protein
MIWLVELTPWNVCDKEFPYEQSEKKIYIWSVELTHSNACEKEFLRERSERLL